MLDSGTQHDHYEILLARDVEFLFVCFLFVLMAAT